MTDDGSERRARRVADAGHHRCGGTAHELQRALREQGHRLRAEVPDVYRTFGSLHDAAMGDGALPARTKELIALALSVQVACDGCVAAHARAAARLGASEQEVAETIGVTVMMGGGPATVQGPRAFGVFREFAAERAAAPGGARDPDETGAASPAAAAVDGRTGTGHGDDDLARLLHDLAVANDYHPDLPMRPAAGDGG